MADKYSPKQSEEELESQLNPSPQRYRVPFFLKVLFIGFIGLSLGTYFYMVISRREAQKNYLLHNQMAAVKLVDRHLPNIDVFDLNSSQNAALTEIADGWILLNIWATWCPPCQAEMASLDFLQRRFGGGLKILALSVDDDIQAVKDFITTNNPSFSVLWDEKKLSSKLFGIDKYPETFLITPDGEMVAQFSGPRNWSSPASIDYFVSVVSQR